MLGEARGPEGNFLPMGNWGTQFGEVKTMLSGELGETSGNKEKVG